MPREGHDRARIRRCGRSSSHFYPRAPGGARQLTQSCGSLTRKYFYPRAPGGARRRGARRNKEDNTYFYPRAPGGARPGAGSSCLPRLRHFYPRAPGGARPPPPARAAALPGYFYPRAPGGARLPLTEYAKRHGKFLSTCPGRGTTRRWWTEWPCAATFLSTCPGRGTTITPGQSFSGLALISIHVPREGHDRMEEILDREIEISIHVPREGHDHICSFIIS